MEQQPEHHDPDDRAKKLFQNAMKDKWEEVYSDYVDFPDLQIAEIDRSKDTVLHVAILKGSTKAVRKLVEKIDQGKLDRVLGAPNEKGNTALHLAAALGFLDMCKCLTDKFPGAIKMENTDKETPFFLAARAGKKDVFLHLYDVCRQKPEVAGKPASLFRRSDGDTILHAAINGEYCELAYEIIQKYKAHNKEVDVIDQRDSHGNLPLHVLANKPHAFESGNPPGIYDWVLYQCVILNMPKIDPKQADERAKMVPRCPANYETCMLVIDGFRSQIKLLNNKRERSDVEKANTKAAESRGNSTHEDTDQSYPPTYETFVYLLKFIVKLMFVILGFGIASISDIQERKKKHYWANLVMNELIEGDKTYDSEGDGGKPSYSEVRSEGLDLFGAELSLEPEAASLKPPEYAATLVNIWDTMGEQKETRESSLKRRLKDLGTKIHQDVDGILGKYDLAAEDGPDETTKHLRLKKRDDRRSSRSETPFLVAARTGVTEIVEGLLDKYPTVIHDMDPDGKNALLLAVEHRQTQVWKVLLSEKIILRERLLRQVDEDGNTALHLAATCSEHQPRTPGVAMQMHWEMKWFEFVKKTMPSEYRSKLNNKRQTPRQVLIKSHQELNAKAGEWITKTSESCSVVAALIATVAFATSATIPGGTKDSGEPNLKDHPLFHVFAISSLIALCLSVTSLVLFLTILTSRFQVDDFTGRLPWKLLFGLTSLFASIAAILVSFCAGHFFLLKGSVKNTAYPIYIAICLPVTYFGLAQVPLYIDLLTCILLKQPQASYIMD